MSNRLVSIIVITKGKNNYLASCLNSLKEQDYPQTEVIVVDNSLKPYFAREISRDYPKIRLYSGAQSLSYCESMNMGLRMCNGDFVLSLNDDVILGKQFIGEALRGFDLGSRVAMVSGKILRFDAKTIDSTGLYLSVWRTAAERGYGQLDTGQFEKEEYIFGVNGAVAFYRRKMLEQLKIGPEYFDSDFRFFYEDLDIAWRAQNFGWKGYYIPTAAAYHVRGATSRGENGINKRFARRYLNDELQFDLLKNRYLVIIKNESFRGFISHLPFILTYEICSWFYVIFSRPKLIKNVYRLPGLIKSAFIKRRVLRKMKVSHEKNI